MDHRVIIFLCLTITLSQASGDEPHSVYKRLYDYILKESGSPYVIPATKLPIRVGVQLGIISIHDVNKVTNIIDLTRWGSITWKSDIMWNPADFSGLINITVPVHTVWRPELHLYNTLSGFDFTRAPSVVVFANGFQALFSSARSKMHCGKTKLSEDSCSFLIGSWGSNNRIIRINEQRENPFDMNKMLAKEEREESRYKVTSFEYRKRSVQMAMVPEEADLMEFFFSFKERTNNSTSIFPTKFKALFSWN